MLETDKNIAILFENLNEDAISELTPGLLGDFAFQELLEHRVVFSCHVDIINSLPQNVNTKILRNDPEYDRPTT